MTLRGQIKASEKQIAFMAKFMRDHPEVAAGYNCGGHAVKLRINRLWKELTQRLNALNGPNKKTQQWRRTWNQIQNEQKKIAERQLNGYPSIVDKVSGVLTPLTIVGKEDTSAEPTSENTHIPSILTEDLVLPGDWTIPNHVVLSATNYNKPTEAKPLNSDVLPEDGPSAPIEDLEDAEETENNTQEDNNTESLNGNVNTVTKIVPIAQALYPPDSIENCITENYIVSSIPDPNSEGMPLIPDNESNSIIDDSIISTVQTDSEEMHLIAEDPNNCITENFIVTVPSEEVPLIADISNNCLAENYMISSNPNLESMMLNPNATNNCIAPNFIISPTAQQITEQPLIADSYSVAPGFIVSSTPESVANFYVSAPDNNPVVPLIPDNNCIAPSYIMSAPPTNPEAVQLIPDNINNCMAPNFIVSPAQPHPLSMVVSSGVELYPISMLMSPNLDLGPSFYIVNQ